MPHFRLETFGRLSLVDADGREDRALATRPRKLALLAWLAMRPGRRATRDRIIGVFWAERDEQRARNSLSDALSHLRRVLGREAVQTIGNEIVLAGADVLDVDALEMAAAAAAADHERVTAIYRGPFLDGFYIQDAPELDDWRDRERTRFAALFAKSAAIRAQSLAGDDERRELAERWLGAEPLSADAALLVLRAIDAAGTRAAHAATVEAYEALVRRLEHEVGVAPDRRVTAFAREAATKLSALPQDPPPIAPEVAAPGTPRPPATETRRPPSVTRSRRARVIMAATAGLVAIALTLAAVQRSQALDHHRVVVLSFENRTGDTTLTAFGRVVSDWLSRGLTEAHSLEVVDPLALDPKTAPPDPRTAGREARAGIVVAGAYVRQADSIVIDTRIIDANTGRELRSIPSVAAPASKPLEALADLRQRVTGALAAEVDPMVGAVAREGSQPPTYAAYLAWVDGVDRFSHRDFTGAVAPLMRAAAADSSFISPRLWAGAAFGNSGDYVRADSVFQSVSARRASFAPLDRGLYDVWVATLRGDVPAEYAAAREMLAASPGSELAIYLAGLTALLANRPEEASRMLRRIPVERSGAPWNAYGTALATALHYAGRYDDELVEARRRSAAIPDWLPAMSDEARALAALGEFEALDRLIKRVALLPRQAGRSPGSLMYATVIELEQHGHARQAVELCRRTTEWLHARPDEEQRTPGHRYLLARTLYEAGDIVAADSMMRSLAAERPDQAGYMVYIGTIAAARGDTAEAERASRALEASQAPYRFGFPTLGRARIAAMLGRKAEAVRLVRRALSEGSDVTNLHLYSELLRLRGDEQFEVLIRPEG